MEAQGPKPGWKSLGLHCSLTEACAYGMGAECSPRWPHLAASSSSSSFTNCRGTCRERTLSAICSRIRRWLPSVVGNRYMRQMAPPNTEVGTQEGGCRPTCMDPLLKPSMTLSPVFPKNATSKQTATTRNKLHLNQALPSDLPDTHLYARRWM